MKFLFLLVLLSLVVPSPASALIEVTTYPTSVTIGQSFNITASASALLANTTYYLKLRLGLSDSELIKGQTNNPANSAPDDWLSDSDAWVKFPTFTTDASGNWHGLLVSKASETTSAGNNFFRLRIRRTDDSTNQDSSLLAISLAPAPTATPTPTILPSSTPTPSPAPSPTSSPTPKPTITPTPTSKPTPKHTAYPSPSLEPAITPVVLGEEFLSEPVSFDPTPTIASQASDTNSAPPPAALALIVLGGVGVVGALWLVSKSRSKSI